MLLSVAVLRAVSREVHSINGVRRGDLAGGGEDVYHTEVMLALGFISRFGFFFGRAPAFRRCFGGGLRWLGRRPGRWSGRRCGRRTGGWPLRCGHCAAAFSRKGLHGVGFDASCHAHRSRFGGPECIRSNSSAAQA